MEVADRRDGRSGYAGALLLVMLLVLTVGAFGVTRALRSQDDIVNTVRLTEVIGPGERAQISFRLTVRETRADVLMIDSEGEVARALELARPLEAGTYVGYWDGRGDDGKPVGPGSYRLRVVLDQQDREIEPPGAVEVLERAG